MCVGSGSVSIVGTFLEFIIVFKKRLLYYTMRHL